MAKSGMMIINTIVISITCIEYVTIFYLKAVLYSYLCQILEFLDLIFETFE